MSTTPTVDSELSKLRQNFNALYGIKPKQKEEPAVEPAKEPAAPVEPATDPAAPPADPAAPAAIAPATEPPKTDPAPAPAPAAPAPAAAPPATPTAKPLVEVVEPAVEEVRPRVAPPEPAPEPKEPTKEDLRLEAIKRLEQDNPEHAGLSVRVANYDRQRQLYEQEWLKRNPGSKFDWSDPEHEEWEDRNDPWTDQIEELYEDARIEVKLERKLAKERAKMDEKLNTIKEEEAVKQRMADSASEIAKTMAGSVVKLVKTVDSALGEIVESGGKIDLSDAAVEKLRAKDPVAADMLITEGNRVSVFVEEVEKLVRFSSKTKFDPTKSVRLPDGERFYPHAEFAQFGGDLEDEFAAAKPELTTKGGRKWIRAQDLDRLEQGVIEDKKLSKAEKDAKLTELAKTYWAITHKEIVNAYVADRAEMVKKRLVRLKPSAAPATAAPAAAPAAAAPAAAATATLKPSSPTTASTGDRGGKGEPGSGGGRISKEQALKLQFG